MQSKRIILIVLAIIAIVVFEFWRGVDKSEPKDTVAKEVVTPTKSIVNHTRSENKKEPAVSSKKDTPKKAEQLNEKEEVMYELSQQQFSEEPVVELLSIMTMGASCQRMTYFEVNYEDITYTQKAQLMLAQNKENCQSLLESYPSINSKYNKTNKGRMLILKLASESHYADFVQRAMGVKYMDDEAKNHFFAEMFAHVLKSQSAPLISALHEISR